MNNYITVTDNFNSEIIDNDIIVPNKTYFNIYNNSIEEPFHKFWFYVDNAKLTNIYKEHNVYRFAINNKNEKNKKLLDYLKKLFEYIKTLFNKIYTNISVEIPWKEYENYPYLMNYFSNESTIYVDSKNENTNLNEIQKDQSYSILFELTYIQLIKIISGEDVNYSIKFKFNLILIQKKELDIKAILLNNINEINAPKQKISYSQNVIPIQNIVPEIVKTEKSLSKIQAPISRPLINPLELMSKIKNLNRVEKNEKIETEKNNEPEKDITQYIEQKNKLKKVETEEKTLMPILKKEYEDLITHNSVLKSQELDDFNNNSSLFVELDDLDKLDNFEKNTKLLNSKNKKSTNSKTQKKINKIIEKSDIDLELEFENIAKK